MGNFDELGMIGFQNATSVTEEIQNDTREFEEMNRVIAEEEEWQRKWVSEYEVYGKVY